MEAQILHPLEYLLKNRGPFRLWLKIVEYLINNSIPESMKQKRMKIEVRYARDSSLTLP